MQQYSHNPPENTPSGNIPGFESLPAARNQDSLNLPPGGPPSKPKSPRLTPSNIMALQRTVGNQAVRRLLAKQPARGSSVGPVIQRENTTPEEARKDFGKLKKRMGQFKKTLDADEERAERIERAKEIRKAKREAILEERRGPVISESLRLLHEILPNEVDRYWFWLEPDDAWKNRAPEMKSKRGEAKQFLQDTLIPLVQEFQRSYPLIPGSRSENKAFETAHSETISEFITQVRDALTKIDEHVKEEPPPPKTWASFMGDSSKPGNYHEGTDADPIPVIWYKKEEHYKPIVVPRDIPGTDTKAGTYNFPNGPTVKGRLDTYEIKVDSDFRYAKDTKLTNNKDSNDRTTQVDINWALRQAGVNMNGKDGDHVTDLGFGGKDAENNYWPLKAEVNRRPFLGWRSQYGVNYKSGGSTLKTASITALTGKTLIIKGFMSESDASNVPAEGLTPDAKSGTSEV